MKTKLILTALLSFVFYLLSSQVPQGFNYQAIARDGSGTILAGKSLPVRITIQTLQDGGTTIWKEEHSSVVSNQFGLISLIVGNGTRTGGVARFSDIDWNAQTLYLKTEIQYPGTSWTAMGTTRIWSVPYSMVAKDVEGPITKLGISGTTSSLEEALFEVKNKDGQTIFAVYNEGVRVYVADGAKGSKGGFAVGGFGLGKAESQKYLYVGADSIRAYIYDDPGGKAAKGGFAVGGFNLMKGTTDDYVLISPDSIRMYIDDTGGKAAKGGFAVGGFNTGKGKSTHFLDVATDASRKISPSENRVLWYPLEDKNAFLTGRVLIQSPDSIGVNSVTTGYESRAKGMYSQAMGYKAIARGDYSTAIGKNAVAGKTNSFAFGEDARAKNEESYAFGRGAIASGYRSFALGSAGVDNLGYTTDVATASGNYSFAIGQGSKSIGKGSFSIGIADSAKGDYSTAMGYFTNAHGRYSTSMGNITTASGHSATSMGYFCTASGSSSVSMGIRSSASGDYSVAMGYEAKSKAYGSIAMGYQLSANRDFALATGFGTKANGGSSAAMGWNTNAKSYASVAIGSYNDTTCTSSFSWIPSDPLFVAGNGNGGEASNALTLYKNGNMTIAGALTQNSDVRLKEMITPVENILDKFNLIQPVYFEFKNKQSNPAGRHIGLIAQEVQNTFPELVSQDGKGYLSIEYGNFSAVLLQAIKEQQQQIRSQQKEIDDLKILISSLIGNPAAQNCK